MTYRGVTIASVVLVLGMAVAGTVVAAGLPPDARLPIHWGITGDPDRYAGPWPALLALPGIAAAIALLMGSLPRIEPLRDGLARSNSFYLTSWIAVLGMLALSQAGLVSHAVGHPLPVPRLTTAGLGAMLLLMGNQMGKSRRMYLAGIRTPWTLSSEEVWIRTHRLGGKLFVGAGLLALLAAATLSRPALMLTVLLGALAGAVLVPVVASYIFWRTEQRSRRS